MMSSFVQVELELALNPDSSTYCLARGEQIAYAVDESSTKDKETYYQRYQFHDEAHFAILHLWCDVVQSTF